MVVKLRKYKHEALKRIDMYYEMKNDEKEAFYIVAKIKA